MNRNFTPCNDATGALTGSVAARFGFVPAKSRIQRRTGYATLRIQGFSAESNKQPCKFKDSAQNRKNSPANSKIQCRIEYAALQIQRFNAESKKQPCKFKDSAQNRICSPATSKIQNSRFKACTERSRSIQNSRLVLSPSTLRLRSVHRFAQDKLCRSILLLIPKIPKIPRIPVQTKETNKTKYKRKIITKLNVK